MMKQQILVIHGGDSFATHEEYLVFLKNIEIDFEKSTKRGWKERLGEVLGDAYEVVYPKMPNNMNARYAEWKIWFEKYIAYLEDEVVLLGHSLGGVFLVKYLAENAYSKKIRALFLVAAPYDDEDSGESLVDFTLPTNLEKVAQQVKRVFLYHSKDDPVVPFADLGKYKKLFSKATVRVLEGRGHMGQEEFPEIAEDLRSIW